MPRSKGEAVSIVVPYFNAPGALHSLIAAIAEQTYPHELLELVVIDDGSEVPAEVTILERQRLQSFRSVKVIRHEQNKGRAAARNSGIAGSAGEIIFFNDVEDIPSPDCIRALVEQHRRLSCTVRANIRIAPELRRASAFTRFRDSRYLGARADHRLPLTNLSPRFFATCGVSLERSVLDSVGGFDEEFRRYGGEDEELGVRLAAAGVPLVFCADAEIIDTDPKATLIRTLERYREYGKHSSSLLRSKCPNHDTWFMRLERNAARRGGRGAMRALLWTGADRIVAKILWSLDRRPMNPPSWMYLFVLYSSFVRGLLERDEGVL